MTQKHHQVLTVLLTPDACYGRNIPHIVREMKHDPNEKYGTHVDDTIGANLKRTPKGGKTKVKLGRREPERFAPFLIPDQTSIPERRITLLPAEALFMTIGDNTGNATQSGK